MTYVELLRHLGASLSIPALTEWGAQDCTLLIDGMHIRLRHRQTEGQVAIEADLFEQKRLEWPAARSMLVANFHGDHARDAVFFIDSDGRARSSMRLALDLLDGQSFVEAIEKFVAQLEGILKPATKTADRDLRLVGVMV